MSKNDSIIDNSIDNSESIIDTDNVSDDDSENNLEDTYDIEEEEDESELDENEEISEDETDTTKKKKKKEEDIYNLDCIYEKEEEIFIDDEVDNGKEIIVPDDERISNNILTKYERVKILGVRAKQISESAKIMVKIDNNESLSPMELAKLELKHKVIPFKIKRPIGKNRYEIWKISELEQIDYE